MKAGYIVKQARFDERKNGGQTSNLYTLCSDLPCPDEPENVPVPEDDASDESPAVQPESAPADTCDALIPHLGSSLPLCRQRIPTPLQMALKQKSGGRIAARFVCGLGGSPFLYPLEPYR